MTDLVDSIRELAARERRAHQIDAEWDVRASEVAWRQHAKALPAGMLVQALAEQLREGDAEDARYSCWLALDALPESDLPRLAGTLTAMEEPDARIVATLALLGRARGVPPWLVDTIRATLAEAAPKSSRAQEAVVAILQRAAASPMNFEPGEALKHGARLFNAGKFYEAHEAWEDVWRPMQGPERDFFRGLIQLAVAMKKARESNPSGVVRLLDRADGLLAPYEPEHRGVKVVALRKSMAAIRARAAAWESGAENVSTVAAPRLPV